jgi:hypothetical protein
MQDEGFMNRLRRFDAYPKTLDDFRVKTFGGAAVTIVSGAVMLLLFISELGYYLQTDITPELFVDTSRGQKIKININVRFPHLPCSCINSI